MLPRAVLHVRYVQGVLTMHSVLTLYAKCPYVVCRVSLSCVQRCPQYAVLLGPGFRNIKILYAILVRFFSTIKDSSASTLATHDAFDGLHTFAYKAVHDTE